MGTVRSTSFLGGMRRYVVEVGELRLVVDQPMAEVEASETEIWLSVDPRAGFHVLAGAPNERLTLRRLNADSLPSREGRPSPDFGPSRLLSART